MCGAIVSVSHNLSTGCAVRLFQSRTTYQLDVRCDCFSFAQRLQTIATGCADPSYRPVLSVGGASRGDYVQDKVRPATGREGALGYERYIAIEHIDSPCQPERLRVAHRLAVPT
jgi:hypothetical protein